METHTKSLLIKCICAAYYHACRQSFSCISVHNWRANTRKGLTDSVCDFEVCAGKSRVTDYIFNLLPKRTRRTQLTSYCALLSMNYTPAQNAIHINERMAIVGMIKNTKHCRLLMWNRPSSYLWIIPEYAKKCRSIRYLCALKNKMYSCCIMNVWCWRHNARLYT